MRLTFTVPTTPHPVGGVVSNYSLANAMARRGHDVHVVHVGIVSAEVDSVDKITWFAFDDRVVHRFVSTVDYDTFPDADFIFVMAAKDGVPPARVGLPLLFVRGFGIYARRSDERAFRAPFPKVVPAGWLVEVGRELGVPERQLVVVRNGLDHAKYRILTPPENRPPLVAMVYRDHPTKGAKTGLAALDEARRLVPELRAVVFGQQEPKLPIPDWIVYCTNPPQDAIVRDIYNESRVFISSSAVEGFGKACVEAMSCGCALVTTNNGGSREYAIDGETALVTPPNDPHALGRAIASLIRDDSLRLRLARRGMQHARQFDWDVSAGTLESFLRRYGADPSEYRNPPAGQPVG